MLTVGASTCRAGTGSGQSLAGLWRTLFQDPLRAMLFLPSIIVQMFAFTYIFGHELEWALGTLGTLERWHVSRLWRKTSKPAANALVVATLIA